MRTLILPMMSVSVLPKTRLSQEVKLQYHPFSSSRDLSHHKMLSQGALPVRCLDSEAVLLQSLLIWTTTRRLSSLDREEEEHDVRTMSCIRKKQISSWREWLHKWDQPTSLQWLLEAFTEVSKCHLQSHAEPLVS